MKMWIRVRSPTNYTLHFCKCSEMFVFYVVVVVLIELMLVNEELGRVGTKRQRAKV